MKRNFAIVLMICMAAFMAVSFAENSVEAPALSDPLMGEVITVKSEGQESEPLCVRYTLPQFDAQTNALTKVNAYYRDYAQDLAVAQTDSTVTDDTLELSYEVSHASARYLSIVLHGTSFYASNGVELPTIEASTFAMDGLYAGEPLTLSQMLGLEQEDELSEQTSVAEEMAYHHVWQLVEHNSQNADGGYLDGLTPQSLRAAFYPETDFYLDADGNIVFFIKPGEIAGEMSGILLFPFAPAELLSSDAA